MKKNILIILFLLSVNFIFVAKSQNDDCSIFEKGIRYTLGKIAKDTVVYLNKKVNYFNLEEMKSLYNKDLILSKSIKVLKKTKRGFHITNDSNINCNINFNNVTIVDTYPFHRYYNEKYRNKIPSNIMSSNILYIDDKYAYIRLFVLTSVSGNMTIWLLFKKDKNNEWEVFKRGIYV